MKTIETCICGIARVDCPYHKPEDRGLLPIDPLESVRVEIQAILDRIYASMASLTGCCLSQEELDEEEEQARLVDPSAEERAEAVPACACFGHLRTPCNGTAEHSPTACRSYYSDGVLASVAICRPVTTGGSK